MIPTVVSVRQNEVDGLLPFRLQYFHTDIAGGHLPRAEPLHPEVVDESVLAQRLERCFGVEPFLFHVPVTS